MNLEELKRKMDEEHYIYDDTLSTVLYVALQLGRPLLIEGAAGVGKTEVAKVMAAALDRELVRLQCYEGLDESKALYEWNYQKQLLSIQVNMNAQDREALTRSLFSDEYLLERPLLKSIRSEKPVVLLIDEIDKADEEFEAFLLELLSEMQVTIPEVGTIRANSVPFVVLTSNRARPLSEALRRRCAYLYIEYPDMEKELAILRAKLPHVDDRLCAQVALAKPHRPSPTSTRHFFRIYAVSPDEMPTSMISAMMSGTRSSNAASSSLKHGARIACRR